MEEHDVVKKPIVLHGDYRLVCKDCPVKLRFVMRFGETEISGKEYRYVAQPICECFHSFKDGEFSTNAIILPSDNKMGKILCSYPVTRRGASRVSWKEVYKELDRELRLYNKRKKGEINVE